MSNKVTVQFKHLKSWKRNVHAILNRNVHWLLVIWTLSVQSPCQDNGGCSHFCVLRPNGRTCVCGAGMKLAEDGITCKSLNLIVELLFLNCKIYEACSFSLLSEESLRSWTCISQHNALNLKPLIKKTFNLPTCILKLERKMMSSEEFGTWFLQQKVACFQENIFIQLVSQWNTCTRAL